MGHREDLLEGAKRCLLEKGFARTTARDIVAASGTNLASIGYHYGSKDALLTAAYLDAIEEWGEEFSVALAADGGAGRPAGPMEQFEAAWTRVIELFPAYQRLWALNSEIVAQADRLPEVRQALAKAQSEEGWPGLVSMFHGVDESEVDVQTAASVGKFYGALLNGVMAMWLFDPQSAPSGRDLAEGMRIIVERMSGPRP
jgi:AcrR family transcriptional regulator